MEVFFTMKKTTNRVRNVVELVIAGISLLIIWVLTWGLWIAEAIGVQSKVCLIIMIIYLVANVSLAFIFQERPYSKLLQIACAEAIQIIPAYIIVIVESMFR